ncbi:hypothetical protein PIB30_091836, partial [Stylosanthes scabra]|nr:hypothetical protein [Stylosanthes scabra]
MPRREDDDTVVPKPVRLSLSCTDAKPPPGEGRRCYLWRRVHLRSHHHRRYRSSRCRWPALPRATTAPATIAIYETN